MKKIFILVMNLFFIAQVFGFEIKPNKTFVPSLRRNEFNAIIYQNQLIYQTDLVNNNYIFLDMETLSENKQEIKKELFQFIDYLYYENKKDNSFYGFYTNKKMSRNFYLSQLKNRRSRGQSKYLKSFSPLPLYGNNELCEVSDEYTAELECGFPIAYHNGMKYELPYPLNKVIGQMLETYMFQSYDLFKLVTFVDNLYAEEKNFEPFICICDVIYDGSVTKETAVYEEPSFDSKIISKIDRSANFTVSKSKNYEKEADYQDFWYYISGQDFSGWVRGESLLIEGDTWKDRLALRGEYFTEDDIE